MPAARPTRTDPGAAGLPARARVDPDPAGRLPVPRRQGPGHLRRQGQEPPRPAVVVLPGHRQPPPAHRHDGHHGGQRRVDGRQHRGRGAAAGVLLDQGVRPALQREVPRRQVLPLAGGHGRRGVPAGDGRTRGARRRAPATSAPTATPGRSARPSTCCCGSSRCARAPTASSSGPRRSAGRACSATSTSAPRPCVGNDQRRGAPRDRRRLLRLHGRPDRGLRASASRRRCTPPPRRSTSRRPPGCATTSGAMQQGAGEAGGGARRRHRRRRDRARRGPARGGRPDLLRPRRPDPRPARLGRRPGRRGRHRRAGRGLPAPAVRRATPTPSRARSWCRRCRPTPRPSSSCSPTCGAARSRSGCRSAATRGRSRRPWPATPARRWRCTRPSGPAT